MKDTVTGNEFEQKNSEHYFENENSFLSFIDTLDPVDEVTDIKKNINWTPIERNCLTCGKEFLATHPAVMYCEEHRK